MRIPLLVAVSLLAPSLALAASVSRTFVDEDWVVAAGASEKKTITLEETSAVEVEVSGVRHAEKGFRVTVSEEEPVTARAFHRTLSWAPGAHSVEVRSVDPANRLTVHVRVIATTTSGAQAKADAPPRKVGECAETAVSGVRAAGGEGATTIALANGLTLVARDELAGAEAPAPGDRVAVCLAEVPKDCPEGDERGWSYTVANRRTGQSLTLSNSLETCAAP